ncbi:MAG TPA: phosphate ABC transporter permease subunit PstC [Desulfobulbus sp.]|nr:phosphate ABC transporter permease subunit PstC [Desulfobulbus sp.]
MASPETERKAAAGGSICRPPTAADRLADRVFRGLTCAFAWLTLLLIGYIVWRIGGTALPAMKRLGIGFLTGTTWDPNQQKYGILPEIWGTLYSSLLALSIGGFFGVTIAIFLSEDFLPDRIRIVLKATVELLAAIPSVVYGLWGIYILIPMIRPLANWLHAHLGWLPFFSTSLNGPGMFPAALVLSIMILPTVAAISQDALGAIPARTREAAFGLGATRWETILRVLLPTASRGIFSALVLGFGRALGETMALAMLIGNSNRLTLSLFSPADTLAALLALNFPEASNLEVGVLMYAAVILLTITLLVNIAGEMIISFSARPGGGRS